MTSFLHLPAYNVLLIKYYLQCSDQILSNDTKHLCIPITAKKMFIIEIAYFATFCQIQDMTSFLMCYSGYLWRHCNVPLFVFFDCYKIHSKVYKHMFRVVPNMTMFLLTALSGEDVLSANFYDLPTIISIIFENFRENTLFSPICAPTRSPRPQINAVKAWILVYAYTLHVPMVVRT